MSLTYTQARQEFIDAGQPVADDIDGFTTICPACPGERTVSRRADGSPSFSCLGGCSRSDIGTKLAVRSAGYKAALTQPEEGPATSWTPVDLASVLAGAQ